MFCSAICACFGQVLWKLSSQQHMTILPIIIGFLLYAVGAVFMIISYMYGKLSILQPIQSINYIFSMILGYVVFEEAIDLKRTVGVLLIIIGVIGIIGGDEE